LRLPSIAVDYVGLVLTKNFLKLEHTLWTRKKGKKILIGYRRRIGISQEFFGNESLQIFGSEIFVELISISKMRVRSPRILIVRVI
jgi:hypothetical protein